MSQQSKIEWTDATWNPTRGCTSISPGCDHCYAETFAERFRGVVGHPYEQGFNLRLVPEKLNEPRSWKRPRMVFVNSMSDLFHAGVPFDYVDQVVGVMAAVKRHTYQVLTKRASRLAAYLLSRATAAALPNAWWGVSVEDRKHGLPRIDYLRSAPAVVRFVSFEPLLEDLGAIDLTGIHWAIIGGESGHGARPCNLEWIRSIVAQCCAQGVPVFVKQLGAVSRDMAYQASPLSPVTWKDTRSPKGKDIDTWPTDLRIREFPTSQKEPTR